MSLEKAKSTDIVTASVERHVHPTEQVKAGGRFAIQCFGADGKLKWEAESKNLVVNVGLKDMNDKYFTGVTYSAAWYIGLYGAASSNNPAAGNTMASHAGWTEETGYSNANRPTATFAAATTADPSVITNSASPASFNINATATIGGAFLTSDNTKGGSTGILFSASDFQSPGDRSVVSGDTLNVTYTFSLDAA